MQTDYLKLVSIELELMWLLCRVLTKVLIFLLFQCADYLAGSTKEALPNAVYSSLYLSLILVLIRHALKIIAVVLFTYYYNIYHDLRSLTPIHV